MLGTEHVQDCILFTYPLQSSQIHPYAAHHADEFRGLFSI